MQACTGALNSLMSFAGEVLEDAKLRNPCILENAKFLKVNESDVLYNLEKSAATIEEFVQLMGNFIVDIAAAKARIQKKAP